MRIDRRWFVAMAILFLPLLVVGNAYGESRHRWDIPHLSLSNGVATVSAGGTASALAEDGSEITVTGFGTFTVGDDDVTGGGTWKTVAAASSHGARVETASREGGRTATSTARPRSTTSGLAGGAV